MHSTEAQLAYVRPKFRREVIDEIFRGLVTLEDVADVEEPFAFLVPLSEAVTEAFVPRELTHFDPDDAEIRNSISAETRYLLVS